MGTALIGFVALLVVAFLGFPLGLSMLLTGFVGVGLLRGWEPALETVAQQIIDVALNTNFAVLPMFLLMGTFVYRAALSNDLYDCANAWFGHFKGGLALATVAACGGFSAISGSSAATAATMAKVAVPSMRRFNYADSIAAGTVAAGGTMGFLIPPSAALIVYGILTEESIADLFIAGIVPGILTIAVYMLVIAILARIRPADSPPGNRATWAERWRALYRVWAVLALFLLILVGISFGIFTPNEAGGIGAIGALAFAVGRKRMSWRIMYEAILEAAHTTALIFTIIIGALVLNNFVILSGLSSGMVEWIETLSLPPIVIILIILGFYVALGTVIEGLAMIFLTVPIFVPIVDGLGYDLIWFGIVMVMVVEISLITPPIGLNVFILKSMLPDVPLPTIFKGIIPFFAADIVRLLLVVFFPGIALFLPSILS
ncbi:MAG: TRAP transporter large permease [Alphaproteobacteria bacterium]